MDLYAENILEHYRHPRKQQNLASSSVSHEEKNVSCGDILEISLIIEDEKIKDIGWIGTGCAISQAGMSMVSENLIGIKIDDVLKMDSKDIYEMLGVPIGPRRIKCALLCLHTLKNAILKYKNEKPKSWLDTVGENL